MPGELVLGGRYRVVRHLARGGMAEVYLAHDELLSRTVAVKVLFPELARDEQFVERFRREARAAASLNHHNIVSVYDFGEDDGSWFIVMEYVDGPTLRDIVSRDGPMDPATAAAIAAEVAAALAAAHGEGIVHRDVKPANVLIADDGGTVKVADFGIARAANSRPGLTLPGTVLGTATYLSPEQAQGAAVDARTDIYSLGMVLYEMLAGRPPFLGDSPVAVAYQSVRETPPPPSSHHPGVPAALEAVVMKALAKDPADRQASADQLRDELLAADRAAGDPGATAAIPVAAGAGEATRVVAGPSTTVLPPADAPPAAPARRGPAAAPVSAAAYRRRRAAVIGGLAVVAVLLIVVIAARGSGKATVAVPDEVGRPVADARSDLADRGLDSRVTEQDRAGTAGLVAAQAPTVGASVHKGSTVELFVPLSSVTTATQSTRAPTATTTPTTQGSTTTVATATTPAPTTAAPTTTQAPSTTVVVTTTAPVSPPRT